MDRRQEEVLQLTFGRGYVYSIQYQIAWCTKYRQKILTGQIAEEAEQIIRSIAGEYGFMILRLEIMPDYINMLIDTSPQFHIPNMLRIIKGLLARKIFAWHPELRNTISHLWPRSYFAVTLSDRSSEQLQLYLESQLPSKRNRDKNGFTSAEAAVYQRGAVTESLGLQAGDQVVSDLKDGGLFLKKQQSTVQMFEQFYGKPFSEITQDDLESVEERALDPPCDASEATSHGDSAPFS